eukprot:scaffold99816_cov71-Phaeocystis_antarctica.AAC.3
MAGSLVFSWPLWDLVGVARPSKIWVQFLTGLLAIRSSRKKNRSSPTTRAISVYPNSWATRARAAADVPHEQFE